MLVAAQSLVDVTLNEVPKRSGNCPQFTHWLGIAQYLFQATWLEGKKVVRVDLKCAIDGLGLLLAARRRDRVDLMQEMVFTGVVVADGVGVRLDDGEAWRRASVDADDCGVRGKANDLGAIERDRDGCVRLRERLNAGTKVDIVARRTLHGVVYGRFHADRGLALCVRHGGRRELRRALSWQRTSTPAVVTIEGERVGRARRLTLSRDLSAEHALVFVDMRVPQRDVRAALRRHVNVGDCAALETWGAYAQHVFQSSRLRVGGAHSTANGRADFWRVVSQRIRAALVRTDNHGEWKSVLRRGRRGSELGWNVV